MGYETRKSVTAHPFAFASRLPTGKISSAEKQDAMAVRSLLAPGVVLESTGMDDVTFTRVILTRLEPGTTWQVSPQRQAWRPPTDVYETENDYVIEMDVAGMRREDFQIALQGRRVYIVGIRHAPRGELRAYHQMEINTGEFRAVVDLPDAVEVGEALATYEAGSLRVLIAKGRPRRVDVR